MSDGTDQNQVRSHAEQQYGSAGNLNARQSLHTRFSTNPVSWHRWVFDQFAIPAVANVLELGCGPGILWSENLDRLPDGWQITLSDFSEGMVDEARRKLGVDRFAYSVMDAQEITVPDACLDAVIANHMLYHVPDLAKGLSEIQRVLRPGGCFYAATNGRDHLRELDELHARVGLRTPAFLMGSFELENGAEMLSAWFGDVELRGREDGLAVTEIEPLVDYILSAQDPPPTESQLSQIRRIIGEEITRMGAFGITKSAGMFIARKEALR